ncbi:3-hydroxybutyryl-CoA dehydrogenase [Solwaraspora sp. WMMD406]|uniref:3-hydroxyacyl-CoA dehydrogenase family protein n=1 Tax=Solwaraspora sp. WMMD406 TaxID=3016095 RepID=UPI0024165793|nr:3-hydroxybutyryl-CoA dehydrogenase [Solwaraspora sp. WMMD406]MDG4764259.1 3-hydroxybutyryl-CoA dehydrogenase [Solwaraspora sp. WMMD406]
MSRDFDTVGVVGLGTMGAGIVEVFARNGVSVVAVEISNSALDRGRGNLTTSTDRAVTRGKLSPTDRDALHSRVTFAVGLDALGDVDLVVEAVPERLDLKRRIFTELDQVCKPAAILATNTSSLSVTEISVATRRPDQVIGLHFFNPAPVMKLVEVVRTVVTAPGVVHDVEALCARLGKVGVTIGDRAGFVANALLFGYLNQAVGMVEAGYASREDVDLAVRLGCGLPMGPFALLDLIGLDTAYEILDTMYRRGGRDRRHAPAPLLRQMVTAGMLGRKSGEGFYTYERPGSAVVVPDDRTPAADGVPATSAAPDADGARATVRTVGVVGSGATAAGLVEVFRRGGFDVVSVTPAEDGSDRLARSTAWEQFARSTAWEQLADVDLVVEAVPDDLGVKQEIFARLDEICRPGVVLATTTATLPVIDIAMATRRPADVLGLHLPGPAPTTRLVEVVRTIRTGGPAVETVRAVCAALGKTAVICGDRAGFIVNALLFPYLNDAIRMVAGGYSTPDDIDAAMTLGCGYPTGPFELLDTVGLDHALGVQQALYRQSREPGLAPVPLLRDLVTAGRLGRETRHGFRDHRGD